MPPDQTRLPDADRRTVLKVLGSGAVLGGATRPVAAQEQNFEISVPESVEVESGERVTVDGSITQLASTPDPMSSRDITDLHGIVGFQTCPSDVTGADEIDCTPPSWTEYEIVDRSEEQGDWSGSSTGGEWRWTSPDDITNGETQSFSVTIEAPEDAESGSHELFIICWSYPAGPRILPQPQLDERTSITVSVTESGGSSQPEEGAEEIVLSDFSTIEDQKQEVEGFSQQDSHHIANAYPSGEYNMINDIGVGFDGSVAYGSQCAFYNTFTPETSGEHRLWPRYTIQGESLIKQFEFLPGTAHARNYVAVFSMVATAGDEWIEPDRGERIPAGGDVLETNQRVVYDVAVPSWSNVLQDLSIEMATQLLEFSGRLSANVASALIPALEITEILVEKGVKVDENIGKNINELPLYADLEAGTEYVVETSILAISGVDLYKLEIDTRDEAIAEAYEAGAQALQSLSGSFSRLDVEGEVQHVKVQPL